MNMVGDQGLILGTLETVDKFEVHFNVHFLFYFSQTMEENFEKFHN